jgi:autotransporter-associated beta strand protein
MAVLLLCWQIGQPLQAATFYWDGGDANATGNNINGTGLGGTGTWDTTTANWWNETTDVAWPNTNADTVIFTNVFSALPTLKTVTLSSGITANRLHFHRSGYTLTGGDLTLAGTTPGLYAQMGESVTISSQILGSAGLTKSGGGSIRLTGTNTYTGTTNIAGGALIIGSAAALGGTGVVNVTAGNGTPSNVSILGFTGGSLVLDGSSGGLSLARDLNLEGRGPIGQNGAALLSIGNNTLSGVVATASSTQTPATFRNTRISSVNGTLTLTGTLNVLGTAGTTVTTLGGGNQSGVGNYSLTGILSGTGTLEKSGSGTLFLNPSVTSGFAGRLRVSGSAASGQSTVRVSSLNDWANTTSVFGTANSGTTNAPIDMNGGVLEIRSDASLNFGKNVYQRAASTIFVGQAVGGSGVNGTVTFGNMSYEDNITITFNSRNGYGVSFTTAPVNGGDNGTTITNSMGGNLSFTGNFWSNADNAAARTMTIGGDGNTVINGNVIASAAAFDHILTKTGTGALTITGTGSTLDGAVNVQGSLIITDFRSITNNTSSITLGNATTTVGNLIIGTATAPTAGGLTTSKPTVLNGTTVSPSIYANQSGSNPVILNGAITRPAATTGAVILGGTNTADNIINTGIPNAGTGGVTKLGAGTWVLNATNAYTGATTIQNGTLKLRATAAASDVIGSAGTNTVVFTSNATTGSAGGTLEFRGFLGAATTETLGALTPTAGASTIRLVGNGAAANLTFTSLGATTAASSVNFDTSNAAGGVITLTGQAATSATNLPGTANFQGHLYLNGADFATINGSAQVVAPTYAGTGNFQNALSALVASVHNKLTGSFTNGALTVSSLVTNSQTLTLSGNLVVSTGGILQSGGTATIKSDSATDRLINQTGTAATNVAIRVDLSGDVLNLGATGALVNIGSFTTGGLTKNGAGLLDILGTNAQTGTTNINEGTVRLSGTAARLSATTANLVIRQGATLQLNGTTGANATVAALDGAGTITNMDAAAITFTQTGAGTWNGIFQDGTGVLNVTKAGTTGAPTWTGLNTYTGVTTIGGTTGLVTVDTLANGGVASGIGASTSAASNLVFAGTTAGLVYQGNILDGALTLGSRSASTDRLFTLAAAATGATLSSTVSNNNAIVWSNSGAIVNNTTANATLTLTGTSTGDNTLNPQLVNSSAGGGVTLSVTKAGAGQWNLGNASNTYTGITTLNEGILALNNNGGLPTNSPLLLAPTSATSAAVFQMSGTFDRNLAATATAGSGTVTFGGTIASTTGGVGFAAHTTALTVAIGGVSSPTALTWGSGGFVGTAFAQNLVLNSSTALSSVDFRNAIDFGAAQRTVNVLDNANTGADFAILSGVLSGTGAGGLRKIGTGILKVTGANTYTGVTDHNAGTLIVSSLGNSTSTAGTATSVGISGIGTTFDNTNAITIGNGGTSGAIFVYDGAGEVSDRKIRLNNTTSTTAGVQIHADGSGPLILTNLVNDMQAGAKRLYLRGTNNAGNMITSQLSDNSGALELVIDSNATWILTNSANNFTGTTTVSAGALGIGHDTAIGGAIVNSNGNIFAYGGDRTVSNTMTMNNNANWGFLGDYNLTFANAVLGSSANSNTLFNSIVVGKALTFNGLVANGLTAPRNFTVDGPGETIINGNFTTSTLFGVQIIKTGDGTLTLGGNGTISNWNQVGTGLDVDRGTLKFITNNAINSTAGYAGVTLSPDAADGDIATVDLNGTTQTVNAITATTNGALLIDNTSSTAATFRFGANNTTVNINPATTGARTITDSGTGALSIVKLGNTSTTFNPGMALTYQGATAVEGGSLTIASPVNGTSGISVTNSGSTLALTGGITTPSAITSLVVHGGATLSLLDGAGSLINSLTTLSLGAGAGTATLNLNVGDGATDTLTLLTGSSATLANTITFNLTDAGLSPSTTYTLLNLVDGGITAFGAGNMILGAAPGGFSGSSFFVDNNVVQFTTGTLITGSLFWRGLAGGGTDNTWNADVNNWSLDKANTSAAASIPGQGTDVVFAIDSASGAVVTTLEQNFKINSLTFEAGGTSTPTSVTIAPGAVSTNRLEVAPQVATTGVSITAGGPTSVTISAPFRLGANQTWTVADAAALLTLSGGLQGEKDVTKAGAGLVTLSTAADPTFNTGLTADFTVTAGTLEITNAGALGSTATANLANIFINSGGTFFYDNGTSGTVANNLTLGGGTLSAGGNNQTYSGTVNVSGDSFINMADSNGPATNTARNITLSGLVSGSGSLTIDSNNGLSSGNQFNGTLTMNNAGNTWSGDLTIVRGTATFAAAASPAFTTNNLLFNTLGRVIIQGTNGVTLNRTGTLGFAAGGVGEFQVDNTSGTLGANYIVNQSGAIALGSGGSGATVRVFLADVASAVNFSGAVTLGGNSSISISGGDADSFATMSGVIGDGGSAYGLTVNDDAGGWAQTNSILRLTGLNTFTGNVTLSEGVLEFNTVTNISGGASSLGNGTAITTGSGTLRFVGSTNQATNRTITQNGATTFSANGTGGATITFNGAINAAANNFTLTGATGSVGIISAGITQTGDTATATVSGGTWTHQTGTSRVGDTMTVTGTGTVMNLNSGLFQVRNDLTVTANAVLNLNGTGVLSYNTATLSADASLLITNGGVVNLGANDAVVATEFDRIFIAQGASGATALLDMNTFNLTTSRLILGERLADRTGQIDGAGTLTVTGGDIDLYKGIINANLATTGSTAFEKYGPGTVTLAGNNSGLASTGNTTIQEGTLELDYSASNTAKIRGASALEMQGSNLALIGNALAGTSQDVGSFTLVSGGASTITLNTAGGQNLVLNLNAITRAVNAQDGTVRFVLPSGTQSATNGITTDTLNTLGTGANAILGGWATVNDGSGVFFARNATNAADGNIVAATTTLQDAVASWVAGENISDSTGFTGSVARVNLNSLRFNATAGSDLVVASGGILGITGGGILITSNVGATPSLTGGTIASGAVASNVPEFIITQDSASTFEMGADIRINHAVTKSGAGTLLLTGNNVYNGYTEVQNGTLQLGGGNAIGDTSPVILAANRNTTLQLLANETIGRLLGGRRNDNSDYGMVDVGFSTLSINQSLDTTYSGRFTGSGTIVLNVGSTGNLNYNGQTSTGLFTGSVVVNGGLFQLSGATARLGSAASFTINGAGNFLLDNNEDTNITDRISDTATFTLNSASGVFSGTTIVRGLANRNNDNDDAAETIGLTTFNSGANYLSLEASGGTSAQARIISTGWTRNNAATVNVRGRNLGATSDTGGRTQFKVQDANDAAMLAANIGGGGTIGGTAKNVSVVPWAIGESFTATTLADGNMGNTFLSYVDNRGFVPLNLTNEFSTFAAAASGDNVRESLGADLTAIAGATVNSLILNNTAFAGLDVTGSGAGQTLAITSGALMFTVTGGAASTPYDTTLGGFNSGITVGGTNEYVIHVVNPSSAANTSTLTATLASPLTSSADITKSGRGTLILNQVNTAGGGSNKTTLNEGLLQISDLDNIGGNTGALVFAGGGLRFGAGFTDDISLRTISFLIGGATLDTNGINLTLANSLGSGVGGFTKTGTGNLTLNGTATYTGHSVLSLGTITIGANNALGNGGNLTLAGGTTLALGTNSLTHGLVTTSGASPAITGTGTITASTGFFLNHTGNTTIDAILAGAGGLFKAQANVVTLTGLSSYTGTTEIQAGTLSINSISNIGGGDSALGNAANAENGVIRMGLTTTATTLQYTGSGHTSDRFIGMQGTTGGVTIDADGTGALVLGGVQGEMAGAKTLTLQGSSAGNLINSIGSIADGAGTLSVAKTDTNTWALTGPSTYTGTTTVSSGTLLVNNTTGSGTGSGLTMVNGGTTQGTLGGTGIITGGVTLATNGATSFAQGAVLNPGTVGAAGTLTINTTALTTNNFSRLNFDLNTATTVGGGVNDLLSTNVLPVIGANTQININTVGTLTLGGLYTLMNGYTGTLSDFANLSVNSVFTGVDTTRFGLLQNNSGALQLFITNPTPATAYWAGGINGNWNTLTSGTAATNWRTDATSGTDTLALPGVTTDVFFNTTAPVAGNLTTTLGQNLTIKTLNFTADADSAVIINGNTLTINPGSSSTGITIDGGAAGAVTISSTIALGAAQTWTNNSANPLTVAGAVTGAFGLAVAGSGNTTLSGLSSTAGNNYTGLTTLNAGSLTYSTGDVSLTGGLTLGAAATTTPVTLDFDAINATFGGALTMNINSATASTITVDPGKTLTINNNITLANNADGAVNTLTMSGGGALVVNGTSFTVGNNTAGTNNSSRATLDLSALSAVTATLSGNLSVQLTGDIDGAHMSSLILSNTANTLTAASVGVGVSATGSVNSMTLGAGTNIFRTNTFNIGTGARDSGVVSFGANVTGSVDIKDVAGTGPVAFNMGTGTASTGYITDNVFDVSGHHAVLQFGAVNIGTQTARVGAMTNVFSFNQGTLTMASLNMSSRNTAAGTTSTFNIGGGTVNSGAITMATTGAAAGLAVANLNITGGTVTLSGNITKGGGAGTDTANFLLTGNNTVLDMGGFTLGGSGANALDSVVIEGGTLKNLAEFNGGGLLTKTTAGTLTMDGANTFTGGTAIQGGTVIAVGGANNRLGSGGLILGDGTTSGLLQLGNGAGASNQTFSSLATSGTGTANAIVNGHADFATLTINQSTNTNFVGNIGGPGTNQNNFNVVKSGSGTLVISGAAAAGAAWTGVTTVNGGDLYIDHKDAFAATSTSLTVADGAEFALRGSNLTANQVYGFSGTGNKITVGSGAGTAVLGFRVDGAFNTQLSLLTGQTMTVATGSTFQTAVYVDDAPTAASYILINGAAPLSLHAGGGIFDVNPVIFNGGSFTYALTNDNGGGTYDRWILTPTAQPALGDVWWRGDLGGIATGVWSAALVGPDTNWDNQQANVGAVDAQVPPDSGSIVHFSSDAAANFATTLGANMTIRELIFHSGGTAISVDGNSGLYTLTLGNTVNASGLTMQTGAPNVTITADVALAQAQSFNIADAISRLTFARGISGTGALGINDNGSSTGTMILSGVNGLATYTGATNLVTGRLILQGGADNRLPTTTALTMGNATLGATLHLGDTVNGASNNTIGTLNTGAAISNAIMGGGATASTLTIVQGSTGTFNGVIGGAGTNENQLALVKQGGATLVLNGANTYTGGTTINNGILQLGIAGSINGTTSLSILAEAGAYAAFDLNGRTAVLGGALTLGGGNATAQANIINSTAGGSITLGGTVTYDATGNPLGATIAPNLITAARTFTVNDSSSTSTELTLNGTITASGGITVNGTGNMVANGAWTIAGTNLSNSKSGTGTLTLNAATNTTGTGDWNITGGSVIATVDNALNAADHVVITGTGVQDSVIVTLDAGGGSFTAGVHQGNDIYVRAGARLNIMSSNAIVSATRELVVGDSASTGTGAGRVDFTGGVNINPAAFRLGGAGGQLGNITGSGIINSAGTFSLRGGSIESGITLGGTGAITKVGNGTVTFSGERTTTGATNIQEGSLILDYTTNNNSKIGGVLTLGTAQGNFGNSLALTLDGNGSTSTSQSVTSTTISNTGDVLVELNEGTGQTISLGLGAITRSVVGGTVNFDLSSVANATVTTSSAAGPLGWATVTTGGTTRIGAITGGNIVQATTTTQNSVAAWGPLQNIINTAGYSGTLDPDCNTITSLTFDAAAASTVTIGTGSTLIITSGGILVNSSVGANASVITGGSILGSIASPLGELMVHQNNTAASLTIDSNIINSSGITKSGNGTLALGGTNSFLSGSRLTINEGTVQLSGGNAIGDSTLVIMRSGTTLDLNNVSEMIGNLGVDTTSLTAGTISLGSGTLTVNQTASSTFTGGITGTGNFVKNGAGNLTLTGSNTFSGTVVVNGGQLDARDAGGSLASVSTFTLNGAQFLSYQNDTTERNRVGNSADFILNNTAGTNGLRVQTNQGNTKTENIGDIRIGAGHNVVTSFGEVTNAISVLQADTLTRLNTASQNHGTVLVRGNNLGASSGTRGTIAFDSGAQATLNGFEVGGGGAAASTNISIIPWMVGHLTESGLGNTFVTNVDATAGLRPLASTEYINDSTAITGTLTDNIRYTATAAITAPPTAINSLVLDSATAIALTGSASSMQVTSGAILAAGNANHSIGTITQLTTGGGRDYSIYNTGTGTFTISSALTSAVALVKSGAGTLSLTNTGNLFTDVYLNQGALLFDDLDKVNGTTGTLNFFGGGVRLAAAFADDLSSKVWNINTGGGTIDVSLVTAGTTFANGIDDSTVSSSDTINIATRSSATGSIGQLTIQGASTFTGTTIINHSGISTASAASLILNGSSTAINGNLQIGNVTTGTNDVVVHLGASDQIVDTATLSFVGVSGAFSYFKLLGFNETVAGISDTSGAGVIENRETESVSASGTLTLNSNSDFSFNGFFRDVGTGVADANKLILVKQGTGTQTLSGANIRHSGTTTISGGGLTLLNVTNWQSAIINNATLTLNQTADRTHSNTISGSGTVVKLGTAKVTLSGTNNYSGVTSIEQGTLSISASNNLGDASTTNDIRIANDATLQAAGTFSLGADRDIALSGVGGTIEVTASNVLTTPGVISGDDCQTLTKTGTGTLVLTGANSYAGATNVLAGSLEINNTTGSGTGTGSVTLNNSGTTLAGSGTLAGSVILNAGTILAPGEGNTATSNKTLTFTAATTSITAANDAQIQLGVTTADSIDGNFATWFHTNGGTAAAYLTSVGGIGSTTWNDTPTTGNHDFISAADTIVLGSSATTDKRIAISLNSATGLTYGSIFNLLDWSTLGTKDGTSLSAMSGAGNFNILDNLQLEALSGGLAWDTSVFNSYGILVVVPEPSRALFLMFGLLGLLMRRRRR